MRAVVATLTAALALSAALPVLASAYLNGVKQPLSLALMRVHRPLARGGAAAMAAVLILAVASPAAAADLPDATVEFTAGSADPGTGYSWARGMLHYRDKSYPFRVNGLGITYLDVPVQASGDVHDLATLGDFSGTYSEIEVDAALAQAGSTGAMKNEHGVVIGLRSTMEGLHFDISLLGVSIKLERGAAAGR